MGKQYYYRREKQKDKHKVGMYPLQFWFTKIKNYFD